MKTAIATLLAVGALTSCTIEQPYQQPSDMPATAEPAPTPAPTQPPAPAYSVEENFTEAVRMVHQGPVYVSDRELLDAGWSVCEGAANGVTADQMMALVESSASDQDTYNLLMEVTFAALMILCPEYEYLLDQISTV